MPLTVEEVVSRAQRTAWVAQNIAEAADCNLDVAVDMLLRGLQESTRQWKGF